MDTGYVWSLQEDYGIGTAPTLDFHTVLDIAIVDCYLVRAVPKLQRIP